MSFQLGMVLIGGLALLIWGPWSSKMPDLWSLMNKVTKVTETLRPPVVVWLLEDEASLDTIRDSIDPERIIASSDNAFAIIEGRIFATSIEAANGPLNHAGWSDRRIEFVDQPGMRKPTFAEIEAQIAEAAEASSEDDYDALKSKSSLSQAESLRLLKQMERHGDL
jgi:hypothetical protein